MTDINDIIAADLTNVFFATGSIGVSTAVWTPAGGSPTPVNGRFVRELRTIQVDDMQIDERAPAFRCACASVPGIAVDDAIAVKGEWKVDDPVPDDDNLIITIWLKKA